MSVNPSAISSSPSPASEAGPSRKRPRSEISSEERKEARAHRNRIAAQNSRDRRKAQFSYLERRVAELEEENRQLRVGMAPGHSLADEQRAADKARERENEELRERIKTLEKGWDAVVKALAANGVPTGLPLPSSEPATAPQQPAQTPTQTNLPPQTEPILTQITPLSPAPSHSSLEFGSPMFSASSPSSSDVSDIEPTRHLARVATTSGPVSSGTMTREEQPPVDDATMETLFREILASSPETALLPLEAETPLSAPSTEVASLPRFDEMAKGSLLLSGVEAEMDLNINWGHEDHDVQRLLELLPSEQPVEYPGWESFNSATVGVF
ncbi:uncharacterized protein BT62DRAFT_994203 [Guyanagaster necrorhizus]|uniref:X-box-binding protein 1 n=1 Tax=Guyanagaster necrorhizus TaxID=856835 RepID=A0A9P7VUD9_9AGAR|nr:uncharacterized protein BT62DRAFT_994203 [Guyanagaster necrorhizus MCA 3950]KAG7446640.1 hypothetical protein BT62DRAFT_994203 [Guyanagaster necrorhizus MCA 3950]